MTAIIETLTAKGYTPAASVGAVFGRTRSIDGIVIHHWGVPGQSHDGVVNFFVNGPGNTSAHFVVSAGRIHCLVSPRDAAWHSGSAVGNATTIGIECRPEATDADYATVAELVRFLRAEYGNLPLTPHRNWQATACPGIWDLARLDRLARTTTESVTAQEATVALARKDVELIFHTNIQEYAQDGKTKKGVKPFHFIVGQLNQWFSRVLDGQDDIRKELAALRADLNKKAGG